MTDVINKIVNSQNKINPSSILEDLGKVFKGALPLIEPIIKNFIHPNTIVEGTPEKTNEQMAIEELYKIISFCGIDFVKQQIDLFEKTAENFKDISKSNP